MRRKRAIEKTESDGSENLLIDMITRFSVNRAKEWLRVKFPSFDTASAEDIPCDGNKNEKEYFASAEIVGCITRLPVDKSDDSNKPLLAVAIKMKRDLTERTSRLVQFNFAKKILQNAVAKGARGFSGLPSQGLFFFYDKDGYFRLSLVSGGVEKRKFKFNDAKRQSFYIEPTAANNIVKRRFASPVRTFAELKDVFSVEQLTKEFYQSLFNWYTWAMSPEVNVHFPNNLEDKTDDRKYNNEAIIRMITRLMFTWFIRQRKLVPDELFDSEKVGEILKKFEPDSMEQDTYYRCILQNLFFATFNCPQTGKGKLTRRWIDISMDESGKAIGLSHDYRISTVYRYKDQFKDPSAFLEMMKKVPFLNCALFDCLDNVERKEDGGKKFYSDGFSSDKNRQAFVPNGLFFGESGIINLFNRYEFTINENNADDSDVALDPELLGKVFENLLGAYNPETQETARNATGSFYTPREIVDYMVDESLKNYLKTKVPSADDKRLEDLFDRTKAAEGADTLFSSKETAQLLGALYDCKILDPACGSGAFPMGVLHCMVRLLSRLDPQCISMREQLLARYKADKALVDPTESAAEREERIAELESRLKEGQHYPDYERKLYLIENCIYGVDIQPIATQISKLRFFISLLCDQLRTSYDPEAENFGLLSLPNLEAKFVCANTLIALPAMKGQGGLIDPLIKPLRVKLQENRHKIFRARSTQTKERYKKKDLKIRDQMYDTIKDLLTTPDKGKIIAQELKLKKLEEDRLSVAEPDWEEKAFVQDDLFGTGPAKVTRIDRNKARRDQIDAGIAHAKAQIKAERAKTDKDNVSAVTQFAELVSGWDPYDQNASSKFFDPEWMFNIKDGFDVVIGNPPYISAPDQLKDPKLKEQREILAKDNRFHCLVQKWDLYIAFMELSVRHLLKQGGEFSMIVPYPLTNQTYGKEMRRLLTEDVDLVELVDLDGTKVFESATVSNCIPIVVNQEPDHVVWISKALGTRKISKAFLQEHENLVPDRGTFVWNTSREVPLAKRFSGMHVLGDFCYISVGMVLNSDEKTAKGEFTKDDLIQDVRDKTHPRKYIEAKDISRYVVNRVRYLEYGTKRCPGQLRRPTFPELYEHPKLQVNGFGNIQATIDESDLYLHNHTIYAVVLWRDLVGVENKSIISSITRYSRMPRNEMEKLSKATDLKLILGILNSKYGQILLDGIRGGDFHILPEHIRNIPIPDVAKDQQKPVIALVDQILASKAKDREADTSPLEAKIDQLVYKLYGLTEEEIAVVEGAGEKNPTAPKPERPRRTAVAVAVDEDDEELE